MVSRVGPLSTCARSGQAFFTVCPTHKRLTQTEVKGRSMTQGRDFSALREKLLEEEQSLLREIEHLGAAVRSGEVEIEVEEGDPEITEREKNIALLSALQGRLESVRAALRAMDKGTYGVCERCGSEIPLERLEIYPDASLCVKCQAEVERLVKRGMYRELERLSERARRSLQLE